MYTKVIHSCVAYGAGAFYNPHRPRFEKALATSQTTAPRNILEAYKKKPTRSLELDAFCPPLDIYLSKQVADFQRRMQLSGLGRKLGQVTAAVAAQLRRRQLRHGQCPPLEGYNWAKEWTGSIERPKDLWDSAAAAAKTGRLDGRSKAETHPRALTRSRVLKRSKAATSTYKRL